MLIRFPETPMMSLSSRIPSSSREDSTGFPFLGAVHSDLYWCKYGILKCNFLHTWIFRGTIKSIYSGASLVAQWLRISLPTQGTRVRALAREEPTCRGATKPMDHNHWACILEPASHNDWARVPQLLKPTRLEPMLCNKRSHRNEKPAHCNEE